MKHGTIWPILILNKVKNLVLGKYFKKLSNVTMIIGKFGTTFWLLAPTVPTLKKSYELTTGTGKSRFKKPNFSFLNRVSFDFKKT